MKVQIYKPNSRNQGCACSFSRSFKDGSVFINAVQQASWDEAKKLGSFSANAKNPDKSVAVCLNAFEMANMIDAIDNWRNVELFHVHNDNKTSIKLTIWEKKDFKTKELTGERAWGLSITRNGADSFRLPIEIPEAQLIKQYLIFCLQKIFELDDAEAQNPNSQ